MLSFASFANGEAEYLVRIICAKDTYQTRLQKLNLNNRKSTVYLNRCYSTKGVILYRIGTFDIFANELLASGFDVGEQVLDLLFRVLSSDFLAGFFDLL